MDYYGSSHIDYVKAMGSRTLDIEIVCDENILGVINGEDDFWVQLSYESPYWMWYVNVITVPSVNLGITNFDVAIFTRFRDTGWGKHERKNRFLIHVRRTWMGLKQWLVYTIDDGARSSIHYTSQPITLYRYPGIPQLFKRTSNVQAK